VPKNRSPEDPTPVSKFPSVAQEKKHAGITVVVVDFLADLRLSGSERVLGALALALAEAMDADPGYAKGKIAHELRGILGDLAEAEVSPANLSLLRMPLDACQHFYVCEGCEALLKPHPGDCCVFCS
jgi:hypothetical protein